MIEKKNFKTAKKNFKNVKIKKNFLNLRWKKNLQLKKKFSKIEKYFWRKRHFLSTKKVTFFDQKTGQKTIKKRSKNDQKTKKILLKNDQKKIEKTKIGDPKIDTFFSPIF